MSDWTHINCSIRGEFTQEKLDEIFGKPTLDYLSPNQFIYNSKKYNKQQKLVNESFEQSKLPSGEEPLHYKLITHTHYHNKHNICECFGTDDDVIVIWGDLRYFNTENKKQFKELENIGNNILKKFPYGVRQFILQADNECSRKTHIWYSIFNSKLKHIEFKEEENKND